MTHLAIHEIDDNGVDVLWLNHVTETEYTAEPA
jgi:hypothetical protein